MACKCSEIVKYMGGIAPVELIQNWDNAGLLIGDPEQEINKVLLALDITPEVVDEAVQREVELIITHHPVIFKSINNLRRDNPQGELIIKLIQNNISVYSSHSNLDLAKGGVNDTLAAILGLKDVEVLQPVTLQAYKKLAVFVPVEHIEAVRDAMTKAGAGCIGNYSDCSFMAKGTGTFRPQEGSRPYIGETGMLEKAEEYKIETIVPENSLDKVVKAMLEAHPYEEAAYDVYNIENVKREYGFAKIGRLNETATLMTFAKEVKTLLNIKNIKLVGDINKNVEKVIVSSGSYSDIAKTAKEKGADVIVTGDLRYHDARDIANYGLSAVDAGHFATENIILPIIAKHIKDSNTGIEVIISERCRDIFLTV